MKKQLNAEEREILEHFERGELTAASGAQREMETAQLAARNTFNKTRRVNLRVTERDFNLAHARAREEGIPYQTLLSSVIHKYQDWQQEVGSASSLASRPAFPPA